MHAIIGGTGLAKLSDLVLARREVVRTPYGDPSCALSFGTIEGVDVVFLARHGYGHTIAPHQINYRANIWALRQVGAHDIVAVTTVGGIRADCVSGAIVVPDQIIDYTHGRKNTFFEGPDQPVTHVDLAQPYDASLRDQLLAAARGGAEAVVSGGTYGCTQGPRLETAAEIARMKRDGCDLVGMTGMPEAALARELSLPYAVVAVVAHRAAGQEEAHDDATLAPEESMMDTAMPRVRRLLAAYLRAQGTVPARS